VFSLHSSSGAIMNFVFSLNGLSHILATDLVWIFPSDGFPQYPSSCSKL